jgi:hypothetical protein
MRRALVRVLLVVGGALVVTGIGWLVGTTSASADMLPTVPVPPLSSVTDAISTPTVTTPTLHTPTLPSTSALPGAPALPSAPADLGQVAQQVRLAVTGVGDRVAPVPATDPAPVAVTVIAPVDHPLTVTAPAAMPSVVVARSAARPETAVAHRHSVAAVHSGQRSDGTATMPAGGGQQHLPVLPPLQPAGSGDANAHGSGGPVGGSGGTQLPFVTLLGAAPHTVGLPTTPRLPVAPGQQPGTSPD